MRKLILFLFVACLGLVALPGCSSEKSGTEGMEKKAEEAADEAGKKADEAMPKKE